MAITLRRLYDDPATIIGFEADAMETSQQEVEEHLLRVDSVSRRGDSPRASLMSSVTARAAASDAINFRAGVT